MFTSAEVVPLWYSVQCGPEVQLTLSRCQQIALALSGILEKDSDDKNMKTNST